MSAPSLLAHVRTRVTVDVDSMDPTVAARHAQHTKFSDMTSNQAIVYSEAARPERADLFNAACAQIRSSEAQLPVDSQVADALDLLVCTYDPCALVRTGPLRPCSALSVRVL